MLFVYTFLVGLIASSPLLDASDSIDRGATAIYSVSLDGETVYWLTLESVNGNSNLDVSVSSEDMIFDEFMNLPYGEDFRYALNFAIVSGEEDGDESITIPALDPGLVHIIVHDTGGNGGNFLLKIQ